jgi:hypothetical protein
MSHRRLAAWIATAASTAVGSGGLLGSMVVLSSKLRHKMTDKQDNASSPQNADDNIANSVKLKKRPVVICANETSRAMNVQCG